MYHLYHFWILRCCSMLLSCPVLLLYHCTAVVMTRMRDYVCTCLNAVLSENSSVVDSDLSFFSLLLH